MEYEFNDRETALYEELDAFLQTSLPPDWPSFALQWPGSYTLGGKEKSQEIDEITWNFRQEILKKGYHILSWPKEYGGRECTNMEAAIFDERMSYYGAPMVDILGAGIMGPTILKVGTEENKREWIPKIVSGETLLWLGYSEPNAGSDLSGIRTTAVEDGDDFVINGQKIWSSGAHVTDCAWLIAKTDTDAPRHQGVSIIIVDNNLPGIEIRPLTTIAGQHHFNEVFFDNVRVPKKNLIGQKNKGFYYLMAALEFERIGLVGIGRHKRFFEELVDYVNHSEQDGVSLASLPRIRRQLSEMATKIEIGYLMFWRTADMMDKGQVPTVESSSVKLVTSELSQEMADVSMDILGPYGLVEQGSKWAPLRGLIPWGYLDCIPATIGAGTSEIQRNIIATRGLGLPVYKCN